MKTLIHRVFEKVASQSPDRIAISTPAQDVRYEDLNREANRIAHAIRRQAQLKPGEVVGLLLAMGPDYVAAQLATLKAGGVFLPLDPEAPPRRQQQFVSKAGPALLLCDRRNRALAESLGSSCRVLCVDAVGGEATVDPPLASDGDDGCYIVFTSGSSGEPKAILGSNKGLSHFVHWEIREFGLDQQVRISQLAPPTFDVSLRDIFVPLLAGGTLCIPSAQARASSRMLLDWLDEERVSLVHCVPSLFRQLLRELEEHAQPEARLTALSHLLLAGEPLFGTDVSKWRSLMGARTELVNLYGPSETTLAKAFFRIVDTPKEAGRMIPIGQPLPNSALLIIKDGELCDIGEIGEVYIKTPFMSKGYWKDPQRTEKAFVQNPLTPSVPDRIYRSGDIGRYLADHSVELLGRRDNQVKVNGVRIELAEIERVLLEYGEISQAVVVAHPSADRQSHLVGYYTASSNVSQSELRSFLSQWLPTSMHPAFFVQVEELPLNLHGKVDRRALPRPAELLYQQHPCVEPEGATESAVAELWGEVLELERIGVTHAFVELGGDSLKAIRVLSRIYQRFGVEVKIQELFPSATVREVAELVDALQQGTSSGEQGVVAAPIDDREKQRVG